MTTSWRSNKLPSSFGVSCPVTPDLEKAARHSKGPAYHTAQPVRAAAALTGDQWVMEELMSRLKALIASRVCSCWASVCLPLIGRNLSRIKVLRLTLTGSVCERLCCRGAFLCEHSCRRHWNLWTVHLCTWAHLSWNQIFTALLLSSQYW